MRAVRAPRQLRAAAAKSARSAAFARACECDRRREARARRACRATRTCARGPTARQSPTRACARCRRLLVVDVVALRSVWRVFLFVFRTEFVHHARCDRFVQRRDVLERRAVRCKVHVNHRTAHFPQAEKKKKKKQFQLKRAVKTRKKKKKKKKKNAVVSLRRAPSPTYIGAVAGRRSRNILLITACGAYDNSFFSRSKFI
jgi:hypothetical protein